MSNLITLADIQTIRRVSSNLDETTDVEPLITEAEELDAKPVLNGCGKDFLEKIRTEAIASPADPNYTMLLNGGTYQDRQGNNVTFKGLKHSLNYYALARIIESQPIHLTATGAVQKKNQYSENLSDDSINRQIQTYKTAGWAYMNDVIKFLNEKRTTFDPYWGQEGVRVSTPNITAVG